MFWSFPPHYFEVSNSCWLICDVMMAINGLGVLIFSLNLFPNVFADSSMYSYYTQPWQTCIHRSPQSSVRCCLYLWMGQEGVFDYSASFKMYLYPMLVADGLDTLTKPFCIWHYHVVFVLLSSSGLFLGVCVDRRLILDVTFDLQSVDCPSGILASFKS